MAALYLGKTLIIEKLPMGMIRALALADWRNAYTLCRNAILISKSVGMKDQVSANLEMSLMGM